MNWLDILILVIIAIGAFKGFLRGLIFTLGGLVGWLLSLAVAVMYGSNFKEFLEKQFDLVTQMGNWFSAHLPLPASFQSEGTSLAALQQAVNSLPLPEFMKNILTEELITLVVTEQGPASITGVVGYALADMLAKGIAFLALFILVSLIIKVFLIFVSRGINKTAFIGTLNRFGGLLLGAGINCCILALMLGVLYPLVAAGDPSGFFNEVITSSRILPILLKMFSLISGQVFGLINI